MSVSRRTLVRGTAWSVPALAVAATAPAVAASPSDFIFFGRMPTFSTRPRLTSPDANNSCTTSVVTTTGILAANDNTRYRILTSGKVDWAGGDSVGPRIRLKADELSDFDNVSVTKVTIDYGFAVYPIAGKTTGTWTDVDHTWTNIRDNANDWSTPTRVPAQTMSDAEFKAIAAAAGNTNVVAPANSQLTFPMYRTQITDPATAVKSYSGASNADNNGNFLVIDAAFNYSNETTYKQTKLVTQATTNAAGAPSCEASDVAMFQYARFVIEYTVNGVAYTKTDVVANALPLSRG